MFGQIVVDISGAGAIKYVHNARWQRAGVDKILRRDKRITFFPLAHFGHHGSVAGVADTAVNRDKAFVLAVSCRLLGKCHSRQFEQGHVCKRRLILVLTNRAVTKEANDGLTVC